MKYQEYMERSHFSKAELLAMAHGTLLEDRPEDFEARLPLPPMLMVDRITEMTTAGRRGRIVAERDVSLDDWFFQCHFAGDPVQPGCLGLDGVWQLLGFYCSWRGGLGAGRALGCGEVEFSGQIRPHDSVIRYEIDVRRFSLLAQAGASIVIGDALLLVDDEPIYTIKGARVGTFRGIRYPDYPHDTPLGHGGRMER